MLPALSSRASGGATHERAAPRGGGEAGEADEAARFLEALRRREPWAERALLEEHTGPVTRILARIVGVCDELDDLTQEVFLRALDRVDELRDPLALSRWLRAITVFVARETLRGRRRRFWLFSLPPEQLEDAADSSSRSSSWDPDASAALRATYDVLRGLSPDAQIAFALRYIEGLELLEIAAICEVSLATMKRRLKGAEQLFVRRARSHPALTDWLKEGSRWAQS
jgi:RNA polymerase sigma-70 factor, ECF subfamily